jgi:alanine-glyoxylate transaminase/serine-glyoxylate transaminase/serine-pyruvate transaminase
VIAVKNPDGIADSDLRNIMNQKYGIMISGGLERLNGKIFRIGLMGVTASAQYILPLFSALEFSLANLGYKFERGVGIETAKTILEEIPAPTRVSSLRSSK